MHCTCQSSNSVQMREICGMKLIKKQKFVYGPIQLKCKREKTKLWNMCGPWFSTKTHVNHNDILIIKFWQFFFIIYGNIF